MSASEKLRALDVAMTVGPWRECGADRGGCQCGNVWSIPADAPVGRVISDAELEKAGWSRIRKEQRVDDAAGIAALRSALPLIVDVIEAAESVGKPSPPALAATLTALQAHLTPEHPGPCDTHPIKDWGS